MVNGHNIHIFLVEKELEAGEDKREIEHFPSCFVGAVLLVLFCW